MNISKKLIGEGAEMYLPFALSKARYYAANWTAPRFYTIHGDGVRITINVPTADYAQVTVFAEGGAVYDYLTTDKIEEWPGFGPIPSVGGSYTRVTGVRAQPITSSSIGTPPDWDATQFPARLPTFPTNNRQRVQQYTWWPFSTAADKTLRATVDNYFMESAISVPTLSNVFDGRRRFSGLTYINTLGYVTEAYARYYPDILFDILPVHYSRGRTLGMAPEVKGPLWWRRAAVRKVSHPIHGTRTFVVATDANSNFYAYPLIEGRAGTYLTGAGWYVQDSARQDVAPTVFLPAGVVQPTVTSMLPIPDVLQYYVDLGGNRVLYYIHIDPAYAPLDGAGESPIGELPGWTTTDLMQQNHYLWVFNNDCTKAAAVVNVDEYDRWVSETAYSVVTPRPYKFLKNYSPWIRVPYHTENDRAAEIAAIGGTAQMTIVRRAVVEVDIDIVLTGAGVMDFTFSVAHARTLEDQCFVDADYAFNDPRLVTAGAAPGELLVATFDRYVRDDGTTIGEGTPAAWNSTISTVAGTVRSVDYLCMKKANGALLKSFKLNEAREVVQFNLIADDYLPDWTPSPTPYGRNTTINKDYTFDTAYALVNYRKHLGAILALDLRSMSVVISGITSPTPTSPITLVSGVNYATVSYAFAQKIDDPYPAVTSYIDTPVPPVGPPGYYSLLPYDYKGVVGAYADDTNTQWLDGFHMALNVATFNAHAFRQLATHPDGHAAFAAVVQDDSTGYQAVDFVRRATKRPTGLTVENAAHLASFNAAFDQTRAYTQYRRTELYDPGWIKNYGIWRTFTPTKPAYSMVI